MENIQAVMTNFLSGLRAFLYFMLKVELYSYFIFVRDYVMGNWEIENGMTPTPVLPTMM